MSSKGKIAAALGILALLAALASYIAWTRISAIMVLRWFVEETGIPVEIKKASWDVRWRELFHDGVIRNLQLEIHYDPLDLDVAFDTRVAYKRDKSRWSVQLEPVLRVGDFPPATGTLAFELDVKRNGNKPQAERVSVEFHLHQTKPLSLANASGSLTGEKWKIDGWLQWATHWSSQVELRASNVKLKPAQGNDSLSIDALHLQSDMVWSRAFPMPLDADTRISFDGMQLFTHGILLEEPKVSAGASFHFDGKRFENVDISVDKPVRLRAKGNFDKSLNATASFDLNTDLNEAFTDRAAKWLENSVPLLRRSKANGRLTVKGRASYAPRNKELRATAHAHIIAKTFELPSRDLYVDEAMIDLPLAYPTLSDWGKISFKTAELNSVKLKNVALRARLSTEGLDVTSEDENGDDRPIHQSVWGGLIDIEKLYAHLGGDEGTQFTASVRGGPFKISEIQNDLCLMPHNPLQGTLTFDYPQIVRSASSFQLVGDTNLAILGGQAHVGDLSLRFQERDPVLSFNVDWTDLDLHAIGEWTRLGDMRGSLNGSFTNTRFVLRRDGVVPRSYDFELRGLQRGGNKMSFYGRAVDNILQLLGTNKDDMPWYAQAAVNITAVLRNWLPTHAEILGFKAKVDSEWTELTTFDPPEDVDNRWCDRKKHYLLCGTGFTIPLNTHGIYPVAMKTISFHEWLNGRIEFVKNKIKNDKLKGKKDDSKKCTPFWE